MPMGPKARPSLDNPTKQAFVDLTNVSFWGKAGNSLTILCTPWRGTALQSS